MEKNNNFITYLKAIFFSIIISLFFIFDFAEANNDLLKRGIDYYRSENYEEAINVLEDAYKISPSTIISFYLGLCYKQVGELKKAKEFFVKSIEGKPKVKDAYIELAALLYEIDEIDDSKKWLKEAESLNIMPEKVAFINGLILLKEGKTEEARDYFTKAKSLDDNIKSAADFQISLSYISEKKISKAKQSLQALIETSPNTEIIDFAKNYLAAIDRIIKSQNKLGINFSIGYLYDDNVVSKPTETVGIGAVDNISSKRDDATVADFKISYKTLLSDSFYLSGSYGIYFRNYLDKNDYDMVINSFELTPGYVFKNSVVTFPLTYSHILLDDKAYMKLFYFRPGISLQIIPDNIVQFSLGYINRNLLKYIKDSDPDEDRDSDQFLISIGYIYSFKGGKGLFNTRYEYLYDDTDGKNWESDLHRISSGITYRLLDRLTFGLSGDYAWQNYKNIHTLSGVGVNGFPSDKKKRMDRIYSIYWEMIYELSKSVSISFKHTRIRNSSIFPIYYYKRNISIVEMSYRF